jgi:hypothetical protein
VCTFAFSFLPMFLAVAVVVFTSPTTCNGCIGWRGGEELERAVSTYPAAPRPRPGPSAREPRPLSLLDFLSRPRNRYSNTFAAAIHGQALARQLRSQCRNGRNGWLGGEYEMSRFTVRHPAAPRAQASVVANTLSVRLERQRACQWLFSERRARVGLGQAKGYSANRRCGKKVVPTLSDAM